MTWLLWLLPATPAVVGLLLAVAGRRADRVAPAVAVVVLSATVTLAGWAVATRPSVDAPWLGPLRAGLAVDGLSAVLVATVIAVALAVVVFAAADLGPDEARARFFGLLLGFVAAMLATVTATTLGTLLVAWELMGAASWALIGFWWADRARVTAANTAFLATRAGDLGFYLACAAAFAGLGTLDIDRLATLPSPWLHVVAAGLVVAAAGKSAQLPFSPWLSAAMAGPSPVSALLHSATMVAAGAYLLFRMQPLLAATGWALPVVAWLGAVTAVGLGFVAVAQRDLKQLLAASTCAQMGLLFLAAGVGTVVGGTGHLVVHAAFKSLLFCGAGLYLHILGTKDLFELGGLGRRLPAASGAVTVGALALAGLPPLSGWLTKDEILAAALHSTQALWLLGLVASALSGLYAGKVIAVLWAPAADRPRPHAPVAQIAPIVALAVATIALTAVAVPVVRDAFESLLAAPSGPAPAAWELALSGVLAAVMLLVAWQAGQRRRLVPLALPAVPPAVIGAVERWLGLDRLADVTLVRPTMALACALARIDDRVVDRGVRIASGVAIAASRLTSSADRRWLDGLVEWLASATWRSAEASRRFDDRAVDRAVEGLAAALGRAGRLARRPQTGLLHQYYAQAAAILALLATVLVLAR